MKEMDKLVDIEDSFPYKDIINVDYPFPLIKERQSMSTRAGQFAPFAALTGFDDQVKETERYTDYEVYLDEDNKYLLDEKINYIKMHLGEVFVSCEYFIKDKKKSGGKYITKTGTIIKVDNYKEEIIFDDKEKISINNIVKININDDIVL